MKVVTQIYETNDYSMFKKLEGNRYVNKLHVKRLKESFQKSYLLSPIIVNEKYEIIDGQNRFEAGKQIGVPINFFIASNYGLKEVQMLNENSKNWNKEDYLKAYCDSGYPEYLKFRDFMAKYSEFGIAACETILTGKLNGGSSNSTNSEFKSETNRKGTFAIRYFQEGELTIPNYELSLENAEKIMMIKPYFLGYNGPAFVRAMIGIFKIKYYDHEKFIDRLKSGGKPLETRSKVTQYKLLIEDIYNFRSREKVSLRF